MSSESILYFGLGVLFASFIFLIIIPFIHGYSVKQTTRRLEAGFVVCTQTRDETIEELRNRIASQRAELIHKDKDINRLKIECAALNVDLVSLNTQLKAVESSGTPKRTNVVPMMPKRTESKTATESFDDASIVPTIAQALDEDSWTREENPSDVSGVSASGENDTWVRVEKGSHPMPQRGDAATRMATVFTQDIKAKAR